MGFAFYDPETTGISPAFDQPLQLAVIRTDDAFREIERVICVAVSRRISFLRLRRWL
jgi:exonuclease I